MEYYVEQFGKINEDRTVSLFTLINDNGMRVKITNYGGIVQKIYIPDKNKNLDVVLGRDTLEDYFDNRGYLGAFIGRCANRIQDCKMCLNNITYQLADNDNGNCLHGGEIGFDQKLFNAEVLEYQNKIDLILHRQSPDMEENFPGNLDVSLTYTLTNDNEFIILYNAVSDKDTVINLTNHSYFNLAGHDNDTILDHTLQLNASFYTPNNEGLCPTGEVLSVENTPFDFRKEKLIGRDINENNEQLKVAKGYDHNFAIDGRGLRLAGVLKEPKSGRAIEIYTDLPGIQIYTGNYLSTANATKKGVSYQDYQGIALETQYFPNGMKHGHFIPPIIKAGEPYQSKTIYKFLFKK